MVEGGTKPHPAASLRPSPSCPPTAYRLALPRYYSAPERPLRFTPLPLPTFCTAADVAHHAIPVLILAGE